MSPTVKLRPAQASLRDQDDGRYTIRALDRGMRVLDVLSDGQPRSLTELSERVGLTGSTIFRLLATLASHSYVARDEQSGKYELGPACLDLARSYQEGNVMRRLALPVVQALRDDTMETVHLAVLDGMEVCYIDKLPGLRAIGLMASRVGAHFPAYCTGLGKALLAYTDPRLVRAHFNRVGLHPFTASTLCTVDALMLDLQQVRARGYALDRGEHEPEVRCIAAPIFGASGMLAAALSVAGPASRLDPLDANHALAARTVEAARAVSHVLGWSKACTLSGSEP